MAGLIAALALAVAGGAALSWPFVVSARAWQWRLSERGDLEGAAVNAELVWIEGQGVILSRQGTRHISLISGPLGLPADAGRIVGIEAALPNAVPGQPRKTMVRLLWQAADVAEFKHETREVDLDATVREVRFSLPCPASEVHKLGVQFPGIAGPVWVRSIGLPALTIGERVSLAGRQWAVPEPIANHSINFWVGPRILGHSVNYYGVSLLAITIGIAAFVSLIRRRRNRLSVIVGMFLAIWFVADVQATWSLSRQCRSEVEALRGHSRIEQIAVTEGREIAWAYEQLLQHADVGATFAVVSSDAFAPAHRLGYLLAPLRTRRDLPAEASYIVVIHAVDATHDPQRRQFRFGELAPVAVEKVAEFSPHVYLLRRAAP